MGARQSYNLSKDFENLMKDVPSPFDALPAHLLIKIFAQIIDERAKIRMERVCRRFRSCIQMEASWRFNIELDTERLKSPESLLAFLKRVPKVLKISLDMRSEDLGWLRPQVLEHARKFKLSLVRGRGYCRKDDGFAFLNECSGASVTRLLIMHTGDSNDNLTNFMARCNALQSIFFSGVTVSAEAVLTSLRNKPLRKLEFNDYSAGFGSDDQITGSSMAALMNSVPNHTLHTVMVGRVPFVGLAEFCRQLQPSAAEALKNMRLSVETTEDGEIIQFVRTVAFLFPNLEEVSIGCTFHVIPFACLGCMHSFKFLLDSAEHRPSPISLTFYGGRPDGTTASSVMAAWFDAFTVVFGSSNDYVIEVHDYNPVNSWKRTMRKGQASVMLLFNVSYN